MAAPVVAYLATTRVGRRITVLSGLLVIGALLVPLVLVNSLLSAAKGLDMSNVACAVDGLKVDSSAKGPSYGLTAEQMSNAKTIVSVGAQMGVPIRGQVVAIATALQESDLRNLPDGDRDSVGLFQQRPSQGWGTVQQIMDPVYSSRKFYNTLLQVDGWQSMPVTVAAQKVQRSGYPTAYAKHEGVAVQTVASLNKNGVEQINYNSGCSPVGTPISSQVTGYVGIALQQVGKPYEWGATGPNSFDCSGLIVYSWRQMGYQLNVRTSQEMYNVALPVAAGQEQPGDLIFTEFGKQDGMAGPAHVLVVVKPGVTVEAPRTGLDVRVRNYDAAREGMKFGRLPRSAMDATSKQV
ncbi:C40 family peptidase [Streptomyces sp. NPDC001205]